MDFFCVNDVRFSSLLI